MRALVLLLAAVALAGCQASPALDRLAGADTAPEPWVMETRERVGASHDRSYAVPVGERASAINVTLRLETRGVGTGLASDAAAASASVSPARLTVEVLAPSGLLKNATVDAQRPLFSFETAELPDTGEYTVRVRGQGFSQALQGQDYGASYLLAIEVVHQ